LTKGSKNQDDVPTSERIVENMINQSLNDSKAKIKQRIASISSIHKLEPSKVDIIS
jgi:uncharacterized protein (DUF2164 family)